MFDHVLPSVWIVGSLVIRMGLAEEVNGCAVVLLEGRFVSLLTALLRRLVSASSSALNANSSSSSFFSMFGSLKFNADSDKFVDRTTNGGLPFPLPLVCCVSSDDPDCTDISDCIVCTPINDDIVFGLVSFERTVVTPLNSDP